jgi:hypothetical protein
VVKDAKGLELRGGIVIVLYWGHAKLVEARFGGAAVVVRLDLAWSRDADWLERGFSECLPEDGTSK